LILLNDFVRQWDDTADDAIAAFIATGRSGWYILGSGLKRFEEALADYWGIPFAAGVGSGLDAIEISLRALGCKAGDKVLTTPLSAFATTLAILKIGAVPVFSDIDAYGLIDLDEAYDAVSRDRSIRYFVPVHLYGHALDRYKLARLRERFDICIVEDCAQSIGARSYGAPTGSVGQAAATSFYPTKNLGTMGDGGGILTSDESCLRAVHMLRDYGQSKKYRHDILGYNSRLDELQAGLLRTVYLPRLKGWLQKRSEIAARYLTEIRHQAVELISFPPGSDSSWHLFPILVPPDRKRDFLEHLANRMICAGEHYPVAIPDQAALAGASSEILPGGIERTLRFCRSQVSLPIHAYLTDAEVSKVIDTVNQWAG
jgi:dTDP-3-amino-3,4,6-trideoxy-alpha-D-glucose transaminase